MTDDCHDASGQLTAERVMTAAERVMTAVQNSRCLSVLHHKTWNLSAEKCRNGWKSMVSAYATHIRLDRARSEPRFPAIAMRSRCSGWELQRLKVGHYKFCLNSNFACCVGRGGVSAVPGHPARSIYPTLLTASRVSKTSTSTVHETADRALDYRI